MIPTHATSALQEYMVSALRLALATRGDCWTLDAHHARKHFERVAALQVKLSDRERRLADARVNAAVQEIEDNAPPPPLAHLTRDGVTAVEVDLLAEQMVEARRLQRRELSGPSWRAMMGPAIKGWAAEALAAEQKEAPPHRPPVRPGAPGDGAPTMASLAPTWRGTWEPGISYAIHALVNDKNALWISERPTLSRPGTPDSGWKLAVKSPR
jgi:hypothetical protein